MPNPFDDLTLGEVMEMRTGCLDGNPIGDDTDPLQLAGAVMFMHTKRNEPGLVWTDFVARTRMSDINAFSETMNDDNENPTNGTNVKPS